MRYFLAAILTVIFNLNVAASTLIDERVFRWVDDQETLSGGVVTALLQDKKGLLWIGTQQGLVRYDGYQFTVFRADIDDPNSLSGNYVRSLALAADGRVWVGTLSNGLSIYDATSNRFINYSYSPDVSKGISNERVDALQSDDRGGMWIGTNKGLNYWDPVLKQFIRYPHIDGDPTTPNDDRIRALLIDHQGTLWVGSWNGLNRLKAGAKAFENMFASDDSRVSLADKNTLRLFQAANKQIWFGTAEYGGGWFEPGNNQLHWLPLKDTQQNSLSHPWVTGITQPSNEELWMATYGGGINVIDTQSKRIVRYMENSPGIDTSVGSNEIGPLLTDTSGLVWVGTWGAGLYQYNATNTAFKMLRHNPAKANSLSYADISSSMVANDGVIWVGTSGNGIDLLDLNSGVIGGFRVNNDDPHALQDGTVSALTQSKAGTIWVGTRQGGLYRYLPEINGFSAYTSESGLIDNYVHCILAMDKGILWIGTSGGLNRFDSNSEIFSTISTEDNPNSPFVEQIDALAVDQLGTLWVGAESGLYVLEPGTNQLTRIAHDPQRADSLSHNDVNGLLVDSRNQLWVTTSLGLSRLHSWDGKTARFESINALIGEPGVELGTNLLEDHQHRIWTDANTVVDPAGRVKFDFSPVDGVDLGASWIRSYSQLPDGRLLYGGSKGLLIIDPQKLNVWNYDPPLVLTEMSVDSHQQVPSSDLQLAAGTRSFSIGFAALDYSNPKRNHYSFRLEPYDPDWIETTAERRIATYTNLDPGNYQLKIRGSNRLGKWSSHQLNVNITQLARWYQTSLFKIVMLLFILLMPFLIYRVRMGRLEKAKNILHEMVEARTAELAQALTKVEQASVTDPLTKLHNRRYVIDHIDVDLKLAARAYHNESQPKESDLLFFLFDIDHFKSVNDTYGHSAGDAVLIQFSNILREAFRHSDMLVRWGGEEFLVISRFVDRKSAGEVAERVRQKIENYAFIINDELRIHKTCSIGFAAFPFVTTDPTLISWEQIVDIADIALFAAKRSQRNAWVGLTTINEFSKADLDRLLKNTASQIDKSVRVESSIVTVDKINW